MSKPTDRIPALVLDAVLREVKAARPRRVFEDYSQADWDEVRSRLPRDWRWLSNEQLKHQACNRRKQGAFSNSSKKKRTALWSGVKQAVDDYWSGVVDLQELGARLNELVRKNRGSGVRQEGKHLSKAGGPKRASNARLRALSIRQPFAEQTLTGEKVIEYRSRRTHIRGRVYIYASKAPGDADSYEEVGYTVDELPRGVLVGTVEVVNCTGQKDDFEWHLANPRRLRSPLPVASMPQPGFFWPFGR
jgi:hypothetical protein